MKNRNLKSVVILSTFLLILAAFNLVLSLAPLERLNFASFIIPLVFADAIVLFEAVGITIITRKPERLSRKVLNLPAVWFAYLTSIITVIASAAIIITNGFVAVDMWISLLVEILLLAVAIALFILPLLSKSSIVVTQEKREAKASFYRQASASIDAIFAKIEKPDLLAELMECIHLSDKVSTAESEVVEDKILSSVPDLSAAVDAKDETAIKATVAKLLSLFKERAAIVKKTKPRN